MKYPEHADPRSYKFFHSYYVGVGGNEEGGKMSTHVDTRHEELKPTEHYRGLWCAYCGHRVYSIQPRSLGYDISGYFCVCKDAMDEIEISDKLRELKEKYREEKSKLEMSLPKKSVEVKRKLIDKALKDDYNLDDILKFLRLL